MLPALPTVLRRLLDEGCVIDVDGTGSVLVRDGEDRTVLITCHTSPTFYVKQKDVKELAIWLLDCITNSPGD